MDSGFFAKVGASQIPEVPDEQTLEMLKNLIQQNPGLLAELLEKAGAGS